MIAYTGHAVKGSEQNESHPDFQPFNAVIKIDSKEKALLMMELLNKSAVTASQAKIMGELYDDAQQCLKRYSG